VGVLEGESAEWNRGSLKSELAPFRQRTWNTYVMSTSRVWRVSLISVAALGVLSLGAVAPASAATCPLQKTGDGTTYPVVCKNGKVNDKAEPKLAKSMPQIMALGKNATLPQVKKAVCAVFSDSDVTNPMIESALYFQTTKFGWSKKFANWFNDSIMMGSGKKVC
jgi:hypothetical protein